MTTENRAYREAKTMTKSELLDTLEIAIERSKNLAREMALTVSAERQAMSAKDIAYGKTREALIEAARVAQVYLEELQVLQVTQDQFILDALQVLRGEK